MDEHVRRLVEVFEAAYARGRECDKDTMRACFHHLVGYQAATARGW